MNPKWRIGFAAGLALLSSGAWCGGAAAQGTGDAELAQVRERARIIPEADHHQHVMGPHAIFVQRLEGPLPEVALPPELARVMSERSGLSGRNPDSTRLSAIYSDDAQIFDDSDAPWNVWARGHRSVGGVLSTLPAEVRIVPNRYAMSDSVAYIAAVLLDSEAETRAYLLLGLRRGAAGWKIESELHTRQPPMPFAEPITADRILQVLDAAGIPRGVVHSAAFWLSSPPGSGEEEYRRVREENDWVVAQAAQHQHRLVAFCGVNPLETYAVAEVRRCASLEGVRGVKLHFANSRVDLRNDEHLEKVRQLFSTANETGLAVMVHLWTRLGYGPGVAEIFLSRVLPEAPDVTVQVAHMAGGGGYSSDNALAVYVRAIAAKDPRVANLYFDFATDVTEETDAETLQLIARRMRQIGLERILFGADTPILGRPEPAGSWATFRRRMPLTMDEMRIIAGNLAPYMH